MTLSRLRQLKKFFATGSSLVNRKLQLEQPCRIHSSTQKVQTFFSQNHNPPRYSYKYFLPPSLQHSGNMQFSSKSPLEEKETISVTFVINASEEKTIKVPIGQSMLEAAHENDIDLEGACEGSLACSTCHVIIMDPEIYNKLPEATDEENDMLDLAFGLTETSRLGCQVVASKELDGLRLALPVATRNFAVDGYKPKPH